MDNANACKDQGVAVLSGCALQGPGSGHELRLQVVDDSTIKENNAWTVYVQPI